METILEAKGVCKFFGGLKAVNQVDMQDAKVDIFCIIGQNGAGKTTYFNSCYLIYYPTKGTERTFPSGAPIKLLEREWLVLFKIFSCLNL